MEDKHSLEETLGLEIEINKKHFDLIVTNKDVTDIVTRGLLAKTGLHADLKVTELLSRNESLTSDLKNGLYYRSDKFMTVVTLEDILQGVFKFGLQYVSCWDKADASHLPTPGNEGTIYGMITISNLKEKAITLIVKEAAKNALKRNDLLNEDE